MGQTDQAMNRDCDVLVLGSGPAGTSAALPIVESGASLVMVAGRPWVPSTQPAGTYRDLRLSDGQCWRWLLGDDYAALKMHAALSPKFRVPALLQVFDGFSARTIESSEGFYPVGSLAAGGLSNAWGCGVAEFSEQDLAAFPAAARELCESYQRVCHRIGVSGGQGDDLVSEYGLEGLCEPPTQIHPVAAKLLAAHQRRPQRDADFSLGRSRLAAIAGPRGDRKGCQASGRCLWGCPNQAIYSARMELPFLQLRANCTLVHGLADRIDRAPAGWSVSINTDAGPMVVNCRRLVVAAGTLESTRLVLSVLGAVGQRTRFLSTPMAAYALWVPAAVGTLPASGSALPQLSFALKLAAQTTAHGALFPTTGLPISEFARKAPLSLAASYALFPALLASSLVGNVFLSSDYSDNWLALGAQGKLKLHGGLKPQAHKYFAAARSALRAKFIKRGAVLLPGSFTIGLPGTDVHYGGSIPMSDSPGFMQCNAYGEVTGLARLHVVDGAILPAIPGKSHTLTIMANADRIGRHIGAQLRAERILA